MPGCAEIDRTLPGQQIAVRIAQGEFGLAVDTCDFAMREQR